MNEELNHTIMRVLETLSYREREIIKMRFGLNSPAMSLREVAKSCKVTRERVRQIEAKAIRKLQQPTRTAPLVDFLGLNPTPK